VANWLNIDDQFYDNVDFTIENKTTFAKNKLLHKTALLINERFESVLRNKPAIKKSIRNIYYRFNESKKEELFDHNIIEELQKIYKEPNLKLKKVLIEEGYKCPSWL